jgi:hypothetical protein
MGYSSAIRKGLREPKHCRIATEIAVMARRNSSVRAKGTSFLAHAAKDVKTLFTNVWYFKA